MTKRAFNPQQVAALASGASLTASTAAAAAALVVAEAEAAALAAAAEAALLAAASNPTEAEAAAAAAAAAAALVVAEAEAAATEPVQTESQIVAFLKDQIKDKDVAAVAAQVEIAGLKAQVADMDANFNGLIEIAGKSLSNMQVALGGSAVKIEGMSATAMLAEHARVSATFQDKFKAGGVAAVDAADAEMEPVQVPDALAQARLNASRPTTAKSHKE